jgi:predicted PurR-regulated permease PerM
MQYDRHLRRQNTTVYPHVDHVDNRADDPRHAPFDRAGLFLLAYFTLYCIFYGLTPSIVGALTFGWYLSLIIEVPARQLSRLKFLSYKASVAISTFVIFSLLILGISRIVPIVLEEGKRLFPLLKESVGSFDLPKMLGDSTLGREVTGALQDAGGSLLERTAQLGVTIMNSVFQNLPNFTTGLIVFAITAGYFTYTVPTIKSNLWRFFPASGREKAFRFLAEVYGDIRHFIAGQILIALFVGVVVGSGLALIGIPYALFLGFISGITNFIPYLGVLVAAVPAVVLGLSYQGIMGVLKVAIVLAAANQFEGWILSPRIQGNRMKLNWFIIILSILVSGAVFGLVGILIAIPLVAFFKKFWIWYVQDAFRRM